MEAVLVSEALSERICISNDAMPSINYCCAGVLDISPLASTCGGVMEEMPQRYDATDAASGQLPSCVELNFDAIWVGN